MGLLDQALGAIEGGSLSAELAQLVQNQPGGLAGLAERFHAGGLGDIVQSWIGQGGNLPVSAGQIEQVLGSDAVQGLATKLGIDPAQASAQIAQLLPQLVDKATPGGQLPTGGSLLQEGLGLLEGKLFS